MRICDALLADSDPLAGIAGQCGGRSLERMVLPDRIELSTSPLPMESYSIGLSNLINVMKGGQSALNGILGGKIDCFSAV